MKTEQEIVLQKKSIIIIALMILAVLVGIIDIEKRSILVVSNEVEVEELNSSGDDEIIITHTSYGANEELFLVEVSGEEDIVNIEEIKKDEQIKEKNVVSNKPYVFDKRTPPTEYKDIIQVKATAYCLCKKCCGKNPEDPMYGYTASGMKITPGTDAKVIAVDTSVVPLGTKVYVEGLNGAQNYGYAVAADTGSAIKNNKIDLYMDTHEQALAWGVRQVNLYILENR